MLTDKRVNQKADYCECTLCPRKTM